MGLLEEELESLKKLTGMGSYLRLLWFPLEDPDRHGEVKCDVIIIYDKDDEVAVRTLRHEFFDHLITKEIVDPLVARALKEKTPRILGAILDVLVKALNIFPTVKLDGLTRMADFHRWGYAIAEAIGVGGDAFIEAYAENVNSQSQETLKASLVAHVLLTFMMGRDEWSGTPTALLSKLNEMAESEGISTRVKEWP